MFVFRLCLRVRALRGHDGDGNFAVDIRRGGSGCIDPVGRFCPHVAHALEQVIKRCDACGGDTLLDEARAALGLLALRPAPSLLPPHAMFDSLSDLNVSQ